MSNTSASEKSKFSDYLTIIYKWKKLLIINLSLILIITIVLVLLMPNEYKSTATIMTPPENSTDLGGLGGILSSGSSAMSLGAQLFGVAGSTPQDMLMGILNSRTIQVNVIKHFNLLQYYEIDDENMDKALKAFQGDISFNPNEYGMIEISTINKDPELSSRISNYFVEILDSLNISLNIKQARNNRLFIEKRYNQNVRDLKAAEDSMYVFQKKYGILEIPEQLESIIQSAGEIEAQLATSEIQAELLKQQVGEYSPQYKTAANQVKLLKNKINELKSSDKLSATSGILFPLKRAPEYLLRYYRYYRNIEIQQSILEVVLPIYEQAKVEEQKSIPTILVLDSAVPPQIKDSPKRTFIVLGVFFLGLFGLLLFVFIGEFALTREVKNIIEEKERKFYKSIKRIYRINQ
jgi:tyrosine-protein kinase Etk/Wzc